MIGTGLLVHTFIVRTLTVPAIATLLGEASWWPTHRG
ncbi:MMPL family transporter [Mycobacterium manitobense]|uniref:MMPL family transporter n=1 Tax=[Mycobacterium] manitobense TaxID=190147 RepID=A0A9X3BYW4_9MYCO|nr:MMPL family transporter [[Mycobacterium] manitobense]